MKKIFKSRIFSFILGAVIFSGISVCAYSLSSNDISFTPENSNWKVSNVEEAINDLYKDDTLFIPRYIVNIEGVHGGSGNNYINSENYNTLTIGSRTRSGVAGTTYWRIRAFKDANCTETSILLDTTEASNSIETFDVSEYKCVALEVYCTAHNGVVAWYRYDFNDIKFYR